MFTRIATQLTNRMHQVEGQGMAEYALILALVSVAALVALTSLGANIKSVFATISSSL